MKTLSLLVSEWLSALVSSGEDQWFESHWRRPSHQGVEIGTWILLELERERWPRRDADHFTFLCAQQVEENVDTFTMSPRCLCGIKGSPLPQLMSLLLPASVSSLLLFCQFHKHKLIPDPSSTVGFFFLIVKDILLFNWCFLVGKLSTRVARNTISSKENASRTVF